MKTIDYYLLVDEIRPDKHRANIIPNHQIKSCDMKIE
jgi:hypothetical protein